MKTDSLIAMLAQGAGPAPRAVAARRLLPAGGLGLLISAAAALWLFGPIPETMFATPALWIKLAYAAALAAAAGWLTARLARPVARLAGPRGTVLAVVGAMLMLGAAALLNTPAPDRAAAMMGHSWFSCPFNVLAVSLPALGLALWAVRGLAPGRPRAAGFAAGLYAGAVGALGYALSCVETSPGFVAVWYSLGILFTGAVGAWLGPRVLRW